MENTFISETDDQITLQTSTDNAATWTGVWSTVESGSNQTTKQYVRRRAKFAEDGSTFLEWTNVDSVGEGVGIGVLASGAQYYPTGSKALLQLRTQRGRTTVLTEFERCPWASEVNGVNTEECRSFRVANENSDTDVYEVDLASGQLRHLVKLNGLEVFYAGVSEAEDEVVLIGAHQTATYDQVPRTDGIPGWTFTNSNSVQDQCQASWHAVPPGQGGAIQRLQVPTPDMCFSIFGGGTVSPSVVRRRSGLIPPVPLTH